MNFTVEIKKEIINRGVGDTQLEKKAALSAFVRTCGEYGVVQDTPTFFLVSQTERVAEFFMGVFSELFLCDLAVAHATQDRLRGRDKLVITCPPSQGTRVLSALGILKKDGVTFRGEILPSLVKTDEQKISYIKGAFLGSGSCLLPSDNGSGYHLEFIFPEKQTALDFCRVLAQFEVLARWVERKERFVVYIKSKEAISDFFAVIGVEHALKKFTAFLDKRDEANYDNRARNCMAGNADKSAIAAVKQVVAIRKIEEHAQLTDLSEELRTLAKARLKHTEMTLKELAQLLGESKSCINHRMRKLLELAEEIKE